MELPVSTPIIKPVDGLCNLSCSYCYTAKIGKPINTRVRCMSEKTLRATIDFFCRGQKYVEFIWHGGEPLFAQIDFYRKAVELQRAWADKGVKTVNFIQTNATLVTEEWADFFAHNGFFAGVSLDGPVEIHDKNRHFSSGAGSFDKVMRGIELLQKSGMFNGVICGISSVNQKLPNELFNFFVSKNIKKLKFAWIKNMGNCGDLSTLSISFSQYIDFMIAIFDLWLEFDDPEVEIRDMQSVVNLLLGGNMRECIYMGQCEQFVTVYSDGSIYGCDTFPKTPELSFGSVFEDPSSVRSRPKLTSFQETMKKRNERCKVCKWYHICKGGCAKDHYTSLASLDPIDKHCKELIRYFEHISAKLKEYVV